MIVIDDAQVPAHDRLWCHLASDTSFDELHAFVEPFGIPERGFDGDHYDVPIERRDEVIAAGARSGHVARAGRPAQRGGLRRRRPRSAKRR